MWSRASMRTWRYTLWPIAARSDVVNEIFGRKCWMDVLPICTSTQKQRRSVCGRSRPKSQPRSRSCHRAFKTPVTMLFVAVRESPKRDTESA